MLAAERILRTLGEHRVDYVVIGALAATFQGSPLRTEDVDVCPRRDPGATGAAPRGDNERPPLT